MRVPNTGLDMELRQIVAEGYRLAEHLLRDHRDPASSLALMFGNGLVALRQMALGLYRAVRH